MLCWPLWLFLKEEREHLVSNQEKSGFQDLSLSVGAGLCTHRDQEI